MQQAAASDRLIYVRPIRREPDEVTGPDPLGGADRPDLAPIVATALYGATGGFWSVTGYMAALSLVSLVCVLRLKETYQRDLGVAAPVATVPGVAAAEAS